MKKWIAIALVSLTFAATAQDMAASDAQLAEWGDALMQNEQLGPFRLDMSAEQVKKASTCAFQYGEQVEETATGLFMVDWTSPGCGITLAMGSKTAQGGQTIQRMSMGEKSQFHTQRHIGIGSQMADVMAAYGRERSPMSSDETFIAGSIYGGMIFSFTNGKVSNIFLGAAAE